MKPSTAGVALLASYPPPFGGVANHVQRLSSLLDKRGVEHLIYNAVSASADSPRVVSVVDHRHTWMLRYALTAPERLIYIFSARLEVWLLGAFMAKARGKRVIVRLRNQALPEYLEDPKKRVLACAALRSMTRVIAVSRALASATREAGVPQDRIVYQPGFLPPALNTPGSLGMSDVQRSFVSAHQPLIVANGQVDRHDGVDLYGLDHMVEMMGRLREAHPNVGLAVSFWHHPPKDQPELDRLQRRAEELGVGDQILFYTESRPFVPLLEKADVFIRPTYTDGDANSVREALYLGVPAIASDVVERPEGTILHRTRDLDDMTDKVQKVLASPPPRKSHPSAVDMEAVERYVDLLAELSKA